MHHYGSASSYTQNYPPSSQHGYIEHRSSTAAPYDSAYAPSPALQHEQPRPDDPSIPRPYQSQPQALPRSSYQQQPPNAMRSGSTPLASNAPGYGYANSHGGNPNQQLGSNASSYAPWVMNSISTSSQTHTLQTTIISPFNLHCRRLSTSANYVPSVIYDSGCLSALWIFTGYSAATNW